MTLRLLILGLCVFHHYLSHGALVRPSFVKPLLPAVIKPPRLDLPRPAPKVLAKVTSTRFNFAKFAPKVTILLDNVRLNVNNLRLSTRTATKLLQQIGDEEDIAERMKVMSMMTDIIIAAEKNLKRKPPSSFDVMDLLLFEEDIMLDQDDVLDIQEDSGRSSGSITDNIPDIIKRINIPASATLADKRRITEDFLKDQVRDKATEKEKDLIRAEIAKIAVVRIAESTTTAFPFTTTHKSKTTATQKPGHTKTTTTPNPGPGKTTTTRKPGHVTTTTTQKPGHVTRTTTQKPGLGKTTTTPKPGLGKTTTTQKSGLGKTTTTQKPGLGKTTTTQKPGLGKTTTTQKPGLGKTTTTQKPGLGKTTTTQKPGLGKTTTTQKPGLGKTTTTKKPGRVTTTTTQKPGLARSRAKRKIKAAKSAKWSMPIRYRFKSGFTSTQRTKIRSAINHWRSQTCVRFYEKSGIFGYHIRFFKGSGCWSKVGRKGWFGQPISIGNNCFSKGVIAHEIGHTLGFWHEQSRPDRDKYVSIKWANIKSGKASNFKKRSWKKAMTMGIPYDYSSVMHYSRKSFSNNNKDTIVPKAANYQRTIGQREHISFYDAKLINFRYCAGSCSGHSSLKWSYCRNDGYRDPKSCGRCRCPEGWTGQNCATIKTGSPSSCSYKYKNAIISYRSLKSPGYSTAPPPYLYPPNSACQWRLRAPSGKRIRMYFSGTFSFPTPSRACKEYVEVRFGDLARTGPRFCSGSRPTTVFRSHGRYMVLLFRTKTATHRGFHARYRYERCGGCSGSGVQPVCLRTVRYSCPGKYTTGWWFWKKTHYRANTCYRVDKYCCSSHNKVFSLCIPK